MDRRTLKTALGYYLSRFDAILPFSIKRKSISGIYNYHLVDQQYHTSGQPTATQFNSIQKAGIHTVINLAPAEAENALANEAHIVAEFGMVYQHLPVDFKNPTEQNFQDFCQIMADCEASNTWVHCAANMRVSAFMYRFRCDVLNHEAESAVMDLHHIWQPFGVWKKFVARAQRGRLEG